MTSRPRTADYDCSKFLCWIVWSICSAVYFYSRFVGLSFKLCTQLMDSCKRQDLSILFKFFWFQKVQFLDSIQSLEDNRLSDSGFSTWNSYQELLTTVKITLLLCVASNDNIIAVACMIKTLWIRMKFLLKFNWPILRFNSQRQCLFVFALWILYFFCMHKKYVILFFCMQLSQGCISPYVETVCIDWNWNV